MRHNNYGICKVLSIVIATLLLSSCAEEIWFSDKPMETTDVLTFGMGLPEGWQEPGKTRTGTEGQDTVGRPSIYVTEPVCFDETINGDTITIYAIVEDIPTVTVPIAAEDAKSDTTASTRASDVDSKYDLGVYSYVMTKGSEATPPEYTGANTGLAQFMMNTHVDVDDDFSYSPIKYWPGPDYWVKFFAYSPHAENIKTLWSVASTEDYKLSVTENMPSITYSVPSEVSKQVVLTLCDHPMLAGDTKSKVNFAMSHAMSAVKVKVGTMPEGVVEEIHFSNLKYSGTRRISDTQWSLSSDKKTFAQVFTPALVVTSGMQIGSTSYLMPQTHTDNAEADIYIKLKIKDTWDTEAEARTYELSKPIKDVVGEWQEGRMYTFVITTPEEVSAEVDDQLSSDTKTKSNVVIRNTGLAPIYVRATIIRNWVVEESDGSLSAVASWKESDGVMDWGNGGEPVEGTTNARNWRKGSDGFYYYMLPIPQKGFIPSEDALFKTFKLTAVAPPVPNAILDFSIAVQAVHVKDVKKLWIIDDIKTALP